MVNCILPPERGRDPSAYSVELSILVYLSERKVRGILTRLWFDGCEFTVSEDIEAGEYAEVEILGLGRIRGHVSKGAEGQLLFPFSSECPV